jgi:hypothetical protein
MQFFNTYTYQGQLVQRLAWPVLRALLCIWVCMGVYSTKVRVLGE